MGKRSANRIQITQAIIDTIRAEAARTRVGHYTLMGVVEGAPPGLSGRAIQRWLAGTQRTIDPDHLAFVLRAYEALPSEAVLEITPQHRATLVCEITRTGASSKAMHALLNARGECSLAPSTIANMTSGAIKTVLKSQWTMILKGYADLPDARIVLSDRHRAALAREIERTDARSVAVILDHPSKPEALSVPLGAALIAGELSEIACDQWHFILERLASMPSAPTQAFTARHKAEFMNELSRTGLSPAKLAHLIKSGTTPKYSKRFLEGLCTQRPAHIRVAAWAEIISMLKSLPDKRPLDRHNISIHKRARTRVTIAPAMRDTLNAELDRTGANVTTLLRSRPDSLSPLSPVWVSNWRTGRANSAPKEAWDFVLNALSALPDKNSTPGAQSDDVQVYRHRPDHVPISADDLAALREERQRTGIGPTKLIRDAQSVPAGLHEYMLGAWMSGQTKRALPAHVQWVLRAYAAYPTAKAAPRRSR